MDIRTITDIGILIVGAVLSGILALLWYDIRSLRGGMKNYVMCADCNEKRGVCNAMRQAMTDLVGTHGDSLVTMQDLLRNTTECLARLDERVAALKEQLEMVIHGMEEIDRRTLRRG